jgi:asparagine synthase (glutamine-hydrolysing)
MAHGVGLAHRRLSIIDLSSAGRQPMSNEDGSIWITYNGETYNYRQIRHRLAQQGHVFRTQTDTEILVHLYEEEGPSLVEHLRGMFAFAIWDDRERRLLLARDRLGIKPLYYATTPAGDLVFGSEIKAVVASRLVEPRLQPAALSEYLANRYTTGGDTLYAGIRQLMPGNIAIWRDGELRVRSYWSFPKDPPVNNGRSEATWIEEFRDRFNESVRLRMISDAPIGVFLSGGVDSSAIAALMAQEASAPIKTFSVAFAEREANELRYAREVADTLGADHHEVLVSPDEFFAASPRLVWHEDEPLAFPSNVPLYFVSKLAADTVKVVLTGEGSDELLAGYGKYWRTLYNWRIGLLYARLPTGMRTLVRRVIDRLPSHRLTHKLLRTFLYLPSSLDSLYLENFGVFNVPHQQQLLTREFIQAVVENGGVFDPFAGHRRVLQDFGQLPMLSRLLAVDALTYLHELLMKQDQMSMAASVESRVPFLDHEFVEFAARLPNSLKLRGLSTKHILRRTMQQVLPVSVLERRKMGFPTPLGSWLRQDHTYLLDELLLSKRARERGIFDPAYVERLVHQHRSGTVDHTERLWALLNVEWWFQTCMEPTTAPSMPAEVSVRYRG